MRLSVPGNLLLAGEYLVLDEGGRGLALAVEPRLTAQAVPSPDARWSILAIMGQTRVNWQPEGDAELPLATAMLRACQDALRVRGRELPSPLAIKIDSSAFFDTAGRKTGFGSSAAAAVALALLLGRAAGLPEPDLVGFAATAALTGHRAAQGGRGSGYDVLASLHGGCGLFTGGAQPGWQPLGDLPLAHAVLVSGPAAVRSSEAVGAYRRWLAAQSGPEAAGFDTGLKQEARETLLAMRAGVDFLVAAADSDDAAAFRLALNQAGAAGRRLGEAIGFSAAIPPPPGYESAVVKALGAGNELGLLVPDGMAPETETEIPPGCLPFRPAGGPLWFS